MADTETTQNTVQVSNISPNANEKTVADFFSFCGKITKLYLKKDDGQETSTAFVQFESESAARTALLLTNALIVDRPITVVTYGAETGQITHENVVPVASEHITQRDFGSVPDDQRTKTSVVASLMASGYVLASDAITKAKQVDDEHSITLQLKVGVEQLKVKAHEIDRQYGISDKAATIKNTATESAKKINEDYHITEKVDHTAQQIKSAAANAAAKAQENPSVKSGVDTVKSGLTSLYSTVTGYVNDYKEQTAKAIEEKQKERGVNTSPPAPTEVESELNPIQPPVTTEEAANPTIIAKPL